MSTKVELLRLSKQKLVKQCKAHKVSPSGSKSAMVERLCNSKSFMNAWIKQNPTTTITRTTKKTDTHKKKKKATTLSRPRVQQSKEPTLSISATNKHDHDSDNENKHDHEADNEEEQEFSMNMRRRELLTHGFIREIEASAIRLVIPLDIKKLIKLFVAMFGFDINKKGSHMHVDDLNDFVLTMGNISQKKHGFGRPIYGFESICFSELLQSPNKYHFTFRVRSCKDNTLCIGIVKRSYGDLFELSHSFGHGASYIFCIQSDGTIIERRRVEEQTKQWENGDILYMFVDMDELEISFEVNDVPAKRIVDTVGDEYFMFVAMNRHGTSAELINFNHS